MNWQRFAIDRLKVYTARKKSIETITARLQSIEDDYTHVRTAKLSDAPRGGTAAEDILINNIAERTELEKNLKYARDDVAITESALSVLDDKERRVLELFYISRQKGHVERLCKEFDREAAAIYRFKDAALKTFAMACYGVVEP